jgi:hypothetical protein
MKSQLRWRRLGRLYFFSTHNSSTFSMYCFVFGFLFPNERASANELAPPDHQGLMRTETEWTSHLAAVLFLL